LFGILIQACKQGRPEQFLEACAAAYPGWDVEDIARSMFSSNPFEDVDNPHLRKERVAHEFYQLDPAIQDTIRQVMAPADTAGLQYPYDIAGAVVEWLQTCKPGQVMHPLVVWDISELVHYSLWLTRRWTQAVDIYAVSRFLKTRTIDRASKFVVMYLGDFHTENIAGLLGSIYDTHAYTEDMDSGCVDLTHSIPYVPPPSAQTLPSSSYPLIPDWPMAWDSATTDDEIDEVRAMTMGPAEIEARQTTLDRLRELRTRSLELARVIYSLESHPGWDGVSPVVLDLFVAIDAGILEGEKLLTALCDWQDIVAAAIEKERTIKGRSLQAWLDDVAATLEQYRSNIEKRRRKKGSPARVLTPLSEDTLSKRRRDFKKGVDPAKARQRLAEVTCKMRKMSKRKQHTPSRTVSSVKL
jgi:hypothetical protein